MANLGGCSSQLPRKLSEGLMGKGEGRFQSQAGKVPVRAVCGHPASPCPRVRQYEVVRVEVFWRGFPGYC